MFRDQQITPPQQVAFTRRFGEIEFNIFGERWSVGIEGMEAPDAEALIAALADHIVKPEFVYRHQWRPGDQLMWDNGSVQHQAIQDYDMPQRRLMHRTTTGDAAPF